MDLKNYSTGVQHIGIPTDKYSETLDFYKSLGFEDINQEEIKGKKTAFLRIHNVMLEVYECEEPAKRTGSIEHLALSVEEVDKLYHWKNGIRFFKVEGPNREVIEFCEIL